VERRQGNPCNASDASARLVERASRSCSDGNAWVTEEFARSGSDASSRRCPHGRSRPGYRAKIGPKFQNRCSEGASSTAVQRCDQHEWILVTR
jgi:hypothetical protein